MTPEQCYADQTAAVYGRPPYDWMLHGGEYWGPVTAGMELLGYFTARYDGAPRQVVRLNDGVYSRRRGAGWSWFCYASRLDEQLGLMNLTLRPTP